MRTDNLFSKRSKFFWAAVIFAKKLRLLSLERFLSSSSTLAVRIEKRLSSTFFNKPAADLDRYTWLFFQFSENTSTEVLLILGRFLSAAKADSISPLDFSRFEHA